MKWRETTRNTSFRCKVCGAKPNGHCRAPKRCENTQNMSFGPKGVHWNLSSSMSRVLLFWNSHFGYFHTISVLYNVPLVSHHILYVKNLCFGWFHAILLPHLTHCENQYRVHLMHEFMPPKPFLVFRNKHAQSTILWLRLMFWVVPNHFVAALDTLQKPVSRCI